MKKKPVVHPTLARPWWSRCHNRPIWLCVRGKYDMKLVFTGVPCTYPGCGKTYRVEIETRDRSKWQKVPRKYSDLEQAHFWVVPPTPKGGYPNEAKEEGGET